MLAAALGSLTNQVVVATKVGFFKGTAGHAYEALHIRHQCEQSLKNLKREYLDIYYFHQGNFGPDDRYLDEAVEMMYRLKEEGKVRLVGLSAHNEDDFIRLVPKIRPAVLQSWANALDDGFIRSETAVRKLLEEREMSFVAFTPLGQGLLLDKYRASDPPTFDDGDQRKESGRFTAESLAKLEPKMARLKERFGDATADLCRMALQYILHVESVACVIPGFRNSAQVEMNVAASGRPLTDDDVRFARDTLSG